MEENAIRETNPAYAFDVEVYELSVAVQFMTRRSTTRKPRNKREADADTVVGEMLLPIYAGLNSFFCSSPLVTIIIRGWNHLGEVI
jgi:hypothetical protein